jgi:putative IMPACT (imprinted ancient) family translation regulator
MFHYNDDGEPSGTAGPPILRQIDAHNLTNTAIVVTRYYGGTKLGTGGLIRAYGDAARQVLAVATLIEKVVRVPVEITFDYGDTSPASRVLDRFYVEIIDRDYTDVTKMIVGVRESEVEAFRTAFTNGLGDRGKVSVLREEEVQQQESSAD